LRSNYGLVTSVAGTTNQPQDRVGVLRGGVTLQAVFKNGIHARLFGKLTQQAIIMFPRNVDQYFQESRTINPLNCATIEQREIQKISTKIVDKSVDKLSSHR
jgi:hypothetical protein